jgi:hypothetical protein
VYSDNKDILMVRFDAEKRPVGAPQPDPRAECARWAMRLLADKVVELGIMDSIVASTIPKSLGEKYKSME